MTSIAMASTTPASHLLIWVNRTATTTRTVRTSWERIPRFRPESVEDAGQRHVQRNHLHG